MLAFNGSVVHCKSWISVVPQFGIASRRLSTLFSSIRKCGNNATFEVKTCHVACNRAFSSTRWQNSSLSKEDLGFYKEKGYLVVKDFFSPEEKEKLFECVSEIQHWPFRRGEHMHFFEKAPQSFESPLEKDGWQLCRTENYLDYHNELFRLVGDNSKPSMAAAQLLGDAMGHSLVFKERINYKFPGGGGFAPHQDAPAWSGDDPTKENAELAFMKHTLNMNVAVDPMFKDNGGLEVVVGGHKGQILKPQNPDGTLTDEYCKSQQWTEVKLDPGDVLFFSLYIPHRSGTNLTNGSRRAVYITYAGASHMHPDERKKYYANNRRQFPPAGEHSDDVEYEKGDQVYNWATPIAKRQPNIQ